MTSIKAPGWSSAILLVMNHMREIAKVFLIYVAVLIVVSVAISVWNRGQGARPATAASVISSQLPDQQP